METEVTTLKNGLPLIYRSMPNMETVGIVFAVNYGSVYETLENNGCAHFLEHMLYRGTKKIKTGAEVKNTFKDLCGDYFNGMTGKEIMLYIGKTHKSLFSNLSSLLSEIITESRLDPADIEIERGVILNENLMKKDDTIKIAGWARDKEIFGEHPAALKTLGDNESIQKLITPEIVKKTYGDYFTPDNSVLVVYGAVPEKDILTVAENQFGGFSGRFAGKTIEPASPENKGGEIIIEKPGLNQAAVMLSLKLPTYKRAIKKELAAVDILAGSLERSLMTKIREERGMTYALGVTNDNGKTYSYLTSVVGTQPENADTVKGIVIDEMNKLSNGEFSAETVQKIKTQQARENKIKIAEETLKSAIGTSFNYIVTGEPLFYEEAPVMYESLTLDDLRSACKYFNPTKSVSVIVKPKT